MREICLKIYIGATYHYNKRAKKTSGQFEKILYQEKDIFSFMADALVKYNGWAFMVSYLSIHTPNGSPVTLNLYDNTKYSYVYSGQGYDTQISYILLKDWEIIGRHSNLNPQKEIFKYTPKQDQISLGLLLNIFGSMLLRLKWN